MSVTIDLNPRPLVRGTNHSITRPTDHTQDSWLFFISSFCYLQILSIAYFIVSIEININIETNQFPKKNTLKIIIRFHVGYINKHYIVTIRNFIWLGIIL